MKSDILVYDVFLSTSSTDKGVAEVVRRAFEERGLTVFTDSARRSPEVAWEDSFGVAMAEARAFVAILSRASVNSPWNMIGVGAAQAWGKGIYLLLDGLTEVPGYLRRYPSFPISRLSEVVAEVEQSIQPLSKDQVQVLKDIYLSQGVATDKLGARPDSLARLTRRFNDAAGAKLSPERIRSELIRLRKRGELPRLKRRIG